jgi:hypothetical protein
LPILELIGADRRAATLEYRYRVAGLPWCSSQPINLLAPFRAAPHDSVAAAVPEFCFTDGAFDCATTGWLAGAQRTVQARYRDGWCVLTVAGVGQFQIKPDQIRGPETGPGLSSSTLNETLLGPPLLLALAGNRRFALHASAVRMGGHGLWLFLGDSGAGKSTLAAYVGSQPLCRRVADDVLPVCWDGERLWALPWYPQLKLGREAQCGGGAMPERLEVLGMCQLNFVSAVNSVAVERLSCPDALITLIRQTVSARLFSPALLAAHLDDCARAVAALPGYRLDVPRQLTRLGEVYQALHPIAFAE